MKKEVPEVKSLPAHYGMAIAGDQSIRFSTTDEGYKIVISGMHEGGEVTVIMTAQQFAAMQYVMVRGDETPNRLYEEAEEVFKEWPEELRRFRLIP